MISSKYSKHFLAIALLAATFAGCKKDNHSEPEKALPTVDKIEVGLSNNEMAVIGLDFHLNAEVTAASVIENIQIKIQQRNGETYSKVWKHEIIWDQYKGEKNVTVHKHFDIPADAPEGKYDFLIIVNDQNGAKLEVKKNLAIYSEANLPVNPSLAVFNVFLKGDFFYRDGKYPNPEAKFKKGDLFNSQTTLSGVKGDGKMYLLLINKKFNHRPESIDQIDFTKAIVYDVFEHNNMLNVESFSNVIFDIKTFSTVRSWPDLVIGSAIDNNHPHANPISGGKAWESGNYYYGVVYKNMTYNINFYHYIEIAVENN